MDLYRVSGTDDIKSATKAKTKTKDEDESSFQIKSRGFPVRASIDCDSPGMNTRRAGTPGAGIRHTAGGDNPSLSPQRIQYRRKNETLKETPAQKGDETLDKIAKFPGVQALIDLRDNLRQSWPIPATEVLLFFKQFLALYSAGIDILRALRTIHEGTAHEDLQNIIKDLIFGIETGTTIDKAMIPHPRAFSETFVSMIALGERIGKLDLMLTSVINLLETEINLRRKLKTEGTYPLIVLLLLPVFILTLAFIIRGSIAPMYESMGIELPFLTRLLILAATVLSNPLFIVGVLFFLLLSILWLRSFRKSDSNARKLETLFLSLPILGPLFHKISLLRFCNHLAVIQETGFAIHKGIRLVGEASGSSLFEKIAKDLQDDIKAGTTISDAMASTGFFPSHIIATTKAGEESGELSKILRKVAYLMEIDVDTALATLTSLIGPVFTAITGLIICIVVVAAFYPLAAGITSVVK